MSGFLPIFEKPLEDRIWKRGSVIVLSRGRSHNPRAVGRFPPGPPRMRCGAGAAQAAACVGCTPASFRGAWPGFVLLTPAASLTRSRGAHLAVALF